MQGKTNGAWFFQAWLQFHRRDLIVAVVLLPVYAAARAAEYVDCVGADEPDPGPSLRGFSRRGTLPGRRYQPVIAPDLMRPSACLRMKVNMRLRISPLTGRMRYQ